MLFGRQPVKGSQNLPTCRFGIVQQAFFVNAVFASAAQTMALSFRKSRVWLVAHLIFNVDKDVHGVCPILCDRTVLPSDK